jgi:hypothetical protein
MPDNCVSHVGRVETSGDGWLVMAIPLRPAAVDGKKAIDGRLYAALMASFGRLESRYPLADQNRAGAFCMSV